MIMYLQNICKHSLIQQQKYQYLSSQIQSIEIQNILKKSSKIQSEYFGYYQQALSGIKIDGNISRHITELVSNKIYYSKAVSEKSFNLTVTNKTKGSQIVTLSVTFNQFTFDITILNLAQKSQSESLSLLGIGMYGKAYVCQLSDISQPFIIKRISYYKNFGETLDVDKQIMKRKLREAIKQYCLYKLFSVLKIGPLVSQHLGFDLIVYRDTIQFTMEKCERIKIETDISFLKRELLESLKIMHSLKIIHGDIKPDNAMWSPAFKKHIFIDFGLSQYLNQQVGFKSATYYFFGTYDYASKDMRQLLIHNKVAHVDLYYNDLHALQLTFQCISKPIIQFQLIKEEIIPNREYNNFLQNICLIFWIYTKNVGKIDEFIDKNSKTFMLQQVSRIILELQLCSVLAKITKKLLQRFYFPEQEKILLEYYINKKILEVKINKERKIQFDSRLDEAIDNFLGSINQIIFFFKVSANEDISPRAALRKQVLRKELSEKSVQEHQFWSILVKYTTNPYVNQNQILEVFEIIKHKLHIKQWNNPLVQEFTLFTRAQQIALLVLQRYQLNLFQVSENIRKEIKQIEFSPSFLQNHKQFSELLKINHQFNEKAKNQIADYNFIETTKKLQNYHSRFPTKNQWFHRQFLMGYAHGFTSLASNDPIHEYYKIQQKYLKKFENCLPAKRTKLYSQLKYFLNLSTQKVKDSLYILANFFKNAGNQCFNRHFYTRFHIQQIFCYKELNSHMQINTIFPHINQIVYNLACLENKHFKLMLIFNLLNNFHQTFKTIIESQHKKIDLQNYILAIIQKLIESENFQLPFNCIHPLLTFFNSLMVQYFKTNKFIGKVLKEIGQCFAKQGEYKDTEAYFNYINTLSFYQLITLKEEHSLLKKIIEAKRTEFFSGFLISERDQFLIGEYVAICGQLNEDAQQQINLMKSWIDSQKFELSNVIYNPHLALKISLYYSNKMEGTPFEEYQQILLRMIKKSSHLKIQHFNLIAVFSIKVMFNALSYNLKFIMQLELLQSLENKYKINSNFHQEYKNAIVVIEGLFNQYFSIWKATQQLENKEVAIDIIVGDCGKWLKLASYWISTSIYTLEKSFRLKMNIWMVQLIQLSLFPQLSVRKTKFLMLKSIRNSLFQLNSKLVNKILPKDKKFSNQHIPYLQNKFDKIIQNRSKKVQIKYLSNNISIHFLEVYEFLINLPQPVILREFLIQLYGHFPLEYYYI